MSKSYIIRNAKLIAPKHSKHNSIVDILIEDGLITKVSADIQTDAQRIEGEELMVSTGWTDLRCHLTDPGIEHKDILENIISSASSGGFTQVVTLPNSAPNICDKSSVGYVKSAATHTVTKVLPTGCISVSDESNNLTELFDMHQSGAVAYTNGDRAMSLGLLKKALLYVKPFGGVIIVHPTDKSLENGGMVNESATTVHTGLKTSPTLAEYIAVREQLAVAQYCDAKIHFSCITSAESVKLIREAKKEGVQVTCDVSIFHLCFTDKEVLSFDENFKLYPPLRTEEDRIALVKGVNDGTIDAICSNHTPQNIESKAVEFDYAEYGALSLPLVYPWYKKYLGEDIEIATFIGKLTEGPSNVLGIKSSEIQEGQPANIVVWDVKAKWTFDGETNASLSKNSHEWNEEQVGKVLAVFNDNKTTI